MRDRAPRNRTVSCSQEDIERLSRKVLRVDAPVDGIRVQGRLIAGDIFEVAPHLPREIADLLILDPPYNLTKDYGGNSFRKKGAGRYADWFESVLDILRPTLKPNATIYVCAEWRTSAIIQPILEAEFEVRNRITWEREKGRGARANWKNNAEDIWFCTMSSDYCFNVDAVKLKRRVLAPYRNSGMPKDWRQEPNGKYRLTCPSNVWTDLTVPFWSMPENTDHPTQKPEKLIAKLVVASSLEGAFVLDPFVGSGTTAVVAQKLNRKWCGIDVNVEYLCWALRRLELAELNSTIQGYADGVFWSATRALTSARRASEQLRCSNESGLLLRRPPEFLAWESLTVGALGWGQIQIADSNDIRVNQGYSRRTWMLELCDAMAEFYPREIRKIRERAERFDSVRDYWEAKEDQWA